jgi:hypothetical protein
MNVLPDDLPGSPMTAAHDDGEGARWVSYTELAKARAISKDSAIRLARRERWRKMPGNDADKTVRILVPETYLHPAARPDALQATREDVPQGELSRLISMFETGLVALHGGVADRRRGRQQPPGAADRAEGGANSARDDVTCIGMGPPIMLWNAIRGHSRRPVGLSG